MNELIDALTNLVDAGIRKSQFSTYEEWQEAITLVLKEHHFHCTACGYDYKVNAGCCPNCRMN